MALITERLHTKRLNKYNINIKTIYKDNNQRLERNSDNSHNDNITNGIILEKDYYQDKKLLLKTYNFDPRLAYSFVFNSNNDEIKCPNCGHIDKVNNFNDGCPYCKTYYNMDYSNKDLGTKYHYDQITNSNLYTIITFIIDVIFCIVLMYFYIKFNSRTFNIYDIAKVFIIGGILGVGLYYLFYIIDAMIVVLPIKIYKEKQNKKQIEFWNRMNSLGVDKNTFFNNINYELKNYYFDDKVNDNIIDYDIIDYLEFDDYQKDNDLYVKVKVSLRTVTYLNNKLIEKKEKETFTFKRNKIEITKLDNEINIIKCHNCGSSIDVTKDTCEYCGSSNNYLQEWYLIRE